VGQRHGAEPAVQRVRVPDLHVRDLLSKKTPKRIIITQTVHDLLSGPRTIFGGASGWFPSGARLRNGDVTETLAEALQRVGKALARRAEGAGFGTPGFIWAGYYLGSLLSWQTINNTCRKG